MGREVCSAMSGQEDQQWVSWLEPFFPEETRYYKRYTSAVAGEVAQEEREPERQRYGMPCDEEGYETVYTYWHHVQEPDT